MPQASDDPFSTLSKELFASILKWVPQDARLRDCACVSSSWHAANLASLTSITATKLNAETADSLLSWLLKYGTAAVANLKLNLTQGTKKAPPLSSALGSVLAGLPGLTRLELAGPWQPNPLLPVIGSLPDLQELVLHMGRMREVCALPMSLMSLELSQDLWMWELLNLDPIPEGNLEQPPVASFPALRTLTNLEKLSIKRNDISISFDAVAQLPRLRTCIISQHSIAAPQEPDLPTGLAGISALTSLEHLELAKWMCPSLRGTTPVLSCADCGALTASSQLTFLDLGAWQLSQGLCTAVFREDLQLPRLQELHLGPSFLQTPAATAALASTAPNLTALTVSAASSTNFYEDADYEEYVVSGLCIEGLEGLTALHKLELSDVRLTNPSVWDTLAQISKLTSISVEQASIQCLPGILGLSVLEDLQQLSVNVAWCKDSGFAESYVNLYSSAKDGPLTWQLPAAVVKCAADALHMAAGEEVAPAAALLLDACPATCTAAMAAFEQLEQRVRGALCEVCMQKQLAILDEDLLPMAEQLQEHLSESCTALGKLLPAASTLSSAAGDSASKGQGAASAVGQENPSIGAAGSGSGRQHAVDTKLLKAARCQLAESKKEVRGLARLHGGSASILEEVLSVKAKADTYLSREGQKLLAAVRGVQQAFGELQESLEDDGVLSFRASVAAWVEELRL